jgi:hypothetical protein
MRFLARLLGLVIGASLIAGIASALAAVKLKKEAPPLPDAAADEIDAVVVMDAAQLASTASSFRGGRVVCWYAGTDLDLRGATLDPAGADLEVRTVFGGTRVVVAPGVPVTASGPAVFGGRMNGVRDTETDASRPGLRITGFTVFGGLQVVAAEVGEEIPSWAPERPSGAPGSASEPAAEPAPGAEPAPAAEPAPGAEPASA